MQVDLDSVHRGNAAEWLKLTERCVLLWERMHYGAVDFIYLNWEILKKTLFIVMSFMSS